MPHGSLQSVEEFFEKVYLDPVFREQIRARIMADMASGDAARMRWEDLPITTAAGEKKFVTAINIPLLDQNLMVSTVQDVTTRHRAEGALRESEGRFRTLVEQAGDGFELLDAKGRYVDVNSATCRQLGYSREELLFLSIQDIDPLVSREQYATTFQSLVNNPPITFETVHRRKDGTTFPVEITTSIIRLGNDLRALTIVRDITDRKRAKEEWERLQAQLLQAQKMESVGRLAGGVAHDFNNMLGVILGHGELVLDKLEAAHPLRTHLEEIQKAAQRSADLTRQLTGLCPQADSGAQGAGSERHRGGHAQDAPAAHRRGYRSRLDAGSKLVAGQDRSHPNRPDTGKPVCQRPGRHCRGGQGHH